MVLGRCFSSSVWRTGHIVLALIATVIVGAVSTDAFAADGEVKRKSVLLLSQSPDGHPPLTHEYAAGLRVIEKCLATVSGISVTHVTADGPWPEGPALIREADCIVMFLSEGARWTHEDPRRIEAFAQLAARGGGFITLHWGMGTKEARYIDGYLKLFGGCHGGPDRKYKILDADVAIGTADHPVTRGITNFSIHEEFYYELKLVPASNQFKPILQTDIDGVQHKPLPGPGSAATAGARSDLVAATFIRTGNASNIGGS